MHIEGSSSMSLGLGFQRIGLPPKDERVFKKNEGGR